MEGATGTHIAVTEYHQVRLPLSTSSLADVVARVSVRRMAADRLDLHPGPIVVVPWGEESIRVQFQRDYNPETDE